jgi:Flp pilus assembly protein TadD
VALALTAGCKPKPKDIPARVRTEASHAASEAQFAVSLRDYARAEPLFEQAAKLCPDTGDYWVSLGVCRRRLGNKSGAKSAYEKGLSAFRDAAELDAKIPEPMLQQVYVLALLGRVDDARKTLEKAAKANPNNTTLRAFVNRKQLDRILEDSSYKDIAL